MKKLTLVQTKSTDDRYRFVYSVKENGVTIAEKKANRQYVAGYVGVNGNEFSIVRLFSRYDLIGKVKGEDKGIYAIAEISVPVASSARVQLSSLFNQR